MTDNDPLKNARKKFKETYDAMTPEQQRRAGQAARQKLAEGKEGMYQFKRSIARLVIALLFLLGLGIICYLISNWPDIVGKTFVSYLNGNL